MHSTTVILLHALIVQGFAQDPMDKLMEQLTDKLIDRVKNWANSEDLDKTTLAKAQNAHMGTGAINLYQPMTIRGGTPGFRSAAPSVMSMQNHLKSYGMGSSPLEKLALTAIGATRDVSMAAQVKQVFSSLDPKTQAKFQKVRVAAERTPAPAFMKDMAGITAPVGFFDPVGWTTDMSNKDTLLFFREAELKHGRVGMLASLGMIVGDKFHPWFGGEIPKFGNILELGKFQATNYETFWVSTFIACGALEFLAAINPNQPYEPFSAWKVKDDWTFEKGPIPGDLGFDPLSLKPSDPKEYMELQNKELNNGRLAMLAAAGMIAQEMVTGNYIF